MASNDPESPAQDPKRRQPRPSSRSRPSQDQDTTADNFASETDDDRDGHDHDVWRNLPNSASSEANPGLDELKWDTETRRNQKPKLAVGRGVGDTTVARSLQPIQWSWVPEPSGKQVTGAPVTRPVYGGEKGKARDYKFVTQDIFEDDDTELDESTTWGSNKNGGSDGGGDSRVKRRNPPRIRSVDDNDFLSRGADIDPEDEFDMLDPQAPSEDPDKLSGMDGGKALIELAEKSLEPIRKSRSIYKDAELSAKWQQARYLASLEAKRQRSEEFERRMRRKAKRIANKNINKLHKRGHPPPPGRTPEERRYKNAVKQLIKVNTRDVDYFYSLLPDMWRFWSQLLIRRPQVKKTKMLLFDFHLIKSYEQKVSRLLEQYGPLLASVIGLKCRRPKNIRKFGLAKVIMVCPTLGLVGYGKKTVVFRKVDPPSDEMLQALDKWFELGLASAPRTLRDIDLWMQRAIDRRNERRIQKVADIQKRIYSQMQRQRMLERAEILPMIRQLRAVDENLLRENGENLFYEPDDPNNPYKVFSNQDLALDEDEMAEMVEREEESLIRDVLQDESELGSDDTGDTFIEGGEDLAESFDSEDEDPEMDELREYVLSLTDDEDNEFLEFDGDYLDTPHDSDDERPDELFYETYPEKLMLLRRSVQRTHSADQKLRNNPYGGELTAETRDSSPICATSIVALRESQRALEICSILGVHCEMAGESISLVSISTSPKHETIRDLAADEFAEGKTFIFDLVQSQRDPELKSAVLELLRSLFSDRKRTICIHDSGRQAYALEQLLGISVEAPLLDTMISFQELVAVQTIISRTSSGANDETQLCRLLQHYGIWPRSKTGRPPARVATDGYWLTRPLTRSMLSYAADMSANLVPLFFSILSELRRMETWRAWNKMSETSASLVLRKDAIRDTAHADSDMLLLFDSQYVAHQIPIRWTAPNDNPHKGMMDSTKRRAEETSQKESEMSSNWASTASRGWVPFDSSILASSTEGVHPSLFDMVVDVAADFWKDASRGPSSVLVLDCCNGSGKQGVLRGLSEFCLSKQCATEVVIIDTFGDMEVWADPGGLDHAASNKQVGAEQKSGRQRQCRVLPIPDGRTQAEMVFEAVDTFKPTIIIVGELITNDDMKAARFCRDSGVSMITTLCSNQASVSDTSSALDHLIPRGLLEGQHKTDSVPADLYPPFEKLLCILENESRIDIVHDLRDTWNLYKQGLPAKYDSRILLPNGTVISRSSQSTAKRVLSGSEPRAFQADPMGALRACNTSHGKEVSTGPLIDYPESTTSRQVFKE